MAAPRPERGRAAGGGGVRRPAGLRGCAVLAASAVMLVLCPGRAAAQMGGWQGGGSAALDIEGDRSEALAADGAAAGEAERVETLTFNESVRAVAGKGAVGVAAAVSLRLGGARPAGFVYDLSLLPVGLGLSLGQRTRLGVVAGAGLSGVTGSLPFGWTFPVEGFAETSLGDHVRVAAWAEVTEVAGAGAREGGAADAPWGDELALGATLRWDRRRDRWGMTGGNGYQVGAVVRERAGLTWWGVVLGYSLDAGGG